MAMNPVQYYEFGKSRGGAPNTFIGGVSSVINTPEQLAAKLKNYPSGTNFDAANIQNFTIVGSNIECYIGLDYSVTGNAFRRELGYWNYNIVTYFKDYEGFCKTLEGNCFLLQTNFHTIIANNITLLGNYALSETKIKIADFPLCTKVTLGTGDIQSRAFYNCTLIESINLPICTTYGISRADNATFGNIKLGCKIYAHQSMQTINAGGIEGDLAYAISSRSANITWVLNQTAPNAITDLSVGTVYGTALQLNFTAPTGSTNAIDFYEVYLNGGYYSKIVSGDFITGLTQNTIYNIEVKPIDIYYNKSTSNIVTQTTSANYRTDADANAYINVAGLSGAEEESAYKLITDLKANSLWNKIQAIYPFKGTTASQHKWNAKNPIDTDAGFRLVFTGAGTFSNLGYQLIGSSRANTFFIPSVIQALNSNGITVVCGTNNNAFTTDTVDVGSYNSVTQQSYVVVKNNNTNFRRLTGLNSTQAIQTGINEARGIFTGTKQSATVTDLFRNGVQIATANSGGALPTLPIWIGALNLNGSPYGQSNQRIQMVIIHEGLSDAEVITLHSIIDISESIAGRKTW